ncbi:MAG: dUTP diphosphatase [archaeon]
MKGKILKVMKLSKDAELPEYATETDVGFDLRASESMDIEAGEQKTIKTGIAIEIPEGHVGLVRDRAGITTRMSLHTAAGTFDPAYRGEVSIVMMNYGDETACIEKGMRIAQMLVLPVAKVKIQESKKLTKTARGSRGFGSTGNKEILEIEKELNKDA